MVAAGERGVRQVWFGLEPPAAARRSGGSPSPRARAVLERALEELELYFRGELERFASPLDLCDQGTPFDRAVWEALLSIPHGETRSYGEVARALGRPGAARAVGHACGRNPLPVMVPCHRVVGANGSLTGFGGGIALKSRLLSLETAAGIRSR